MGLSPRISTVYREAVSNSSGNPPSSPQLSQPSTPETQGTAAQPELQRTGPHVSSSQRGSGVVASQGIEMEWEEPADPSPRAGDRDRCILDRMRNLLSGEPHRQTVVGGGTEPPHQSAGATSCSLCPASFPEACQGRPGSRGYRCILSGLGELGLCPPAMVPHYSSPGKDPCPESDVGSGNTMLANTTMVSSIDGNAGGLSTCSSRSSPIPSGHTFPQL